MHPKQAKLQLPTIESLSEVRRNLRISWYRCPIDRNRLIELSRRSDARGLFLALGHLGLLGLTGFLAWYFFNSEHWIGVIISVFLYGSFAGFTAAPHHELCHGSVFKTKWLNEFFLRIFSFLGWQQFPIYRFSHAYHHRFTLHPAGDREEVMPEKPSLQFFYLLQLFTINLFGGYQSRGVIPVLRNTINLALDRFDNPFNYWGPELYQEHPRERRQARNWARILLGLHGLVIVASIASGQWILAVLISGGPFIGNWYRYSVGVTQHCGLRSDVPDFRKCSRTVKLDPFTEFLYWHMNWHLEHHMYAAVPCYNLKTLHLELADTMPHPRTLRSAWREMRETWRRQQSDPTYAFDTPVPAGTDSASDSSALVESMGDLAPTAIAGEMAQKQ